MGSPEYVAIRELCAPFDRSDLETWLIGQPEITRPFETDQLALIRAIDGVVYFDGPQVTRVAMGRGRGTTTILTLATKWLAVRDLWAVVVANWSGRGPMKRGVELLDIYNVANLRGLTRDFDGVIKRPDVYLVDFNLDNGRAKSMRDAEALAKLDIKRGVLVNAW